MQHEMRAKFGLSLSTRAILFDWGTMDDLVEAAIVAEESGFFSGVWVGDNLLSKPRVEAVVALSAIAARTKRITLGTICLASFVMRDPVLLALQWASLDILSKGRTVLAVCNGGSASDGPQFAQELENMDVASNERVGRLIEGIQVMRRLWSEDSVTHQGRFYNFSKLEALPKPVQQPSIPIWVGGHTRLALRRTAKYGDCWHTTRQTPEFVAGHIPRLRRYTEQAGRDPDAISISLKRSSPVLASVTVLTSSV